MQFLFEYAAGFRLVTHVYSLSQPIYMYAWVLFCGSKANSADPDQTPHNAASDQGLHSLPTENYITILIKMKNGTQQPIK